MMHRLSPDILSGLSDAILGMSGDGILMTDDKGIVRFWNPGAVRIFGFTEAEALGSSLDLIIPVRLRGRHWEGYARVMRGGTSRYDAGAVLAVPALTKEGREISIEFSIIVLRDEHHAMRGMAAVVRDVSVRFEELRLLRRQLAELRGKPPA